MTPSARTTALAVTARRAILASCMALAAPLAATLAAQDAPVRGDSAWLRGLVTDTLGVPLRNAEVRVEPGGVTTRTTAEGRFALRVPAGPSTLVVRRIGFGSLRHEIDLEPGQDLRFEIELESVAVVLDAFRVESRTTYLPPGAPAYLNDFYRRRATGFGRYFTRDEIARFGGAAGALNSIPGVTASTDGGWTLTGVNMSRCLGGALGGRVAWFVDGVPMRDAPDVADYQIVAMEVYRGPATMPAEAIGDACGAVYLWLRRD